MFVCPVCYAEYKDGRERCALDETLLAPISAEPLRGHVIDRKYRLEARLGSGGMSVVYLATRLSIGDLAAIKILNRNLIADEQGYRRFEQEARLAASVKHPNVVAVYDFGTTEQRTAYLVMEYLEGPTLSRELRRYGGLSLERALEIFQPVCAAVHAAHKEGLIHRDLKPNNIILQQLKRGDEYIKVVDFGIAKLIGDSRRLSQRLSGGTVFGTLGYMPLEQLTGSQLDPRADIYGLAVTLYQMLAARLPYSGRTVVELYKQMTEGNGPRPLREFRPDIPSEVEQAILRSLSSDRNKRPSTAMELFNAVRLAVRAIGRNRARANLKVASAGQGEPFEQTVPYRNQELGAPLIQNSNSFNQQTGEPSEPSNTIVNSLVLLPTIVINKPNFECFAGREAELLLLEQHYERAAEGRALPIIIVGEPGIGKSQLLAEYRNWAQSQGAISLTGRFFDYGGDQREPYHTFLDMLVSTLSSSERLYTDDLSAKNPPSGSRAELLDIILNRNSNEPTVMDADRAPIIEKWRIFEAITEAFKQLVGDSPAVLIFEDLQWADDLSLELLGYIMRNSVGARLQLIASAREEEAETAGNILREWLIEQSRYRSYELIKLQPFTKIQVKSLLETIFSPIQIDQSALDRLHSETQGNPYFLCEVLRLLIEMGNLRFEEPSWRLSAIDELELPASIINLVSLKLRRFSASELDVFVQAAVIGDEFCFETLRVMTGLEETELETILNKGVVGWILKEQPHSTTDDFRFYHTTIRRVLYNSIAKRHRKKLHARAAAALESVYRLHLDRIAGTLAYHHFLAMNWPSALELGLTAGEASRARQALQPAAKFYEWASEAAEELAGANLQIDPTREFTLRIGYTDTLTVLGRVREAEIQAEAAVALAEQSNRSLDLAWASYMRCRVAQFRGEYQRAAEFASAGLEAARVAGGGEIERRLLQQQGFVFLMLGMLPESRTALERCQQLAQAAGDVKTAGWALSLMGLVLANLGNQQRGLRSALAGVDMLRHAGDRMGELIACERVGIINDIMGQCEAALGWYQQGLAIARALACRKQELTLLLNIGENYRLQGKFDQAEQNCRQALALAQELDNRDVQGTAIQNLGLVALDRNDYQEAAAQLGQALAMHRAQGRQNPEAEVLCDLGRARAGLGDYQDALDLYRASLTLCQRIPYPDYEWRAFYGIAKSQLELGESTAAIESLRAASSVIDHLRAQLPAGTDLNLFMRDKKPVYDLLATLT
ncbi:MAG: protein kinase [Acidobacteriota bacterium]